MLTKHFSARRVGGPVILPANLPAEDVDQTFLRTKSDWPTGGTNIGRIDGRGRSFRYQRPSSSAQEGSRLNRWGIHPGKLLVLSEYASETLCQTTSMSTYQTTSMMTQEKSGMLRVSGGMCCGTEAGSYLIRIDSCITLPKAQGPSRTCNESKKKAEDLKDRPRPSIRPHREFRGPQAFPTLEFCEMAAHELSRSPTSVIHYLAKSTLQ